MPFEGDAVFPFLFPKRDDGPGDGRGVDVQGKLHRERFLAIRKHIRTVSVLDSKCGGMAGVLGGVDGIAFPLDSVFGSRRELQDIRPAVDFPEKIVAGVEYCGLKRLGVRNVGGQGVHTAILGLLLTLRFVASPVFARTQSKKKEYNEREQKPFSPLERQSCYSFHRHNGCAERESGPTRARTLDPLIMSQLL